MILYKYYSAGNGLKAIESRRLGFRSPEYFNDPFELTALSNGDGPGSKLDLLRQQVHQLKEHVVVLSLTRNPKNPLMWAHYGCEHTGIVVGYDVSDVFLTSQEHNLIPVDSGDVIYTHTKSPFKNDARDNGSPPSDLSMELRAWRAWRDAFLRTTGHSSAAFPDKARQLGL